MKVQYIKKLKLPDNPGVYIFKQGKGILYIGKATSLRDRVKSYFGKDLIATRGPLLVDMVTKAEKIEFIETDSVLEALILEANLIKKHQPKYNTKEKDNKSFNYVCITRDKISKVLVVRGRALDKSKYKKVFGPFPNGLQLRTALKIVRRIFPFFDEQSSKKQNIEFYRQINLVPNTKQNKQNPSRVGAPGERVKREDFVYSVEYRKNIKNLILFFEGKKGKIISDLKKEMNTCAKKMQFERANEIKKQIFALEHINDVSLIKDDANLERNVQNLSRVGAPGERVKREGFEHFVEKTHTQFRLEAYDVAHMSGKNMVGVMTVVVGGEPEKSEYKKFIIRTQKNTNDTGALEEVLSRRFRHTEWGLPSLVVVDGSTAQLNVAKQVLSRYQFAIPIVGVVKDARHKPKALIGDEVIIKKHKKDILLANSEAHRFAITFYRQKSRKNMLK